MNNQIWDTGGLTAQQRTLVQAALFECSFDWGLLLPGLNAGNQWATPGRSTIPVTCRDLSSFTGAITHLPHDGHVGYHAIKIDKNGKVMDEHSPEVAAGVLGLFWFDGRVEVEQSLVNNPPLFKEVFLSEGAHAADFFFLWPNNLRQQLYNIYHPNGADTHGYFEGPYFDMVGEAFMGGFVYATTGRAPTLMGFSHPTTATVAGNIKKLLRIVEPPPPMPTGTWLDFCMRRDGPTQKIGYAIGKTSPKRGEIKHSAEGGLAGIFSVLDNLANDASWQFTIAYDKIYQHYPVEANCWHGNDTDDDQNVRANIDLVGIEHLGKAGEPLTPYQIDATVALTVALAKLTGRTPMRFPQQSGWTMAEHNELGNTPTACPSGRIPWGTIHDRLFPVVVPPEPMHVFLWGDANAGMSKYARQQFHWNEGIAIDAYGDYEGLFPGQHWHNEGGIWKQVLP